MFHEVCLAEGGKRNGAEDGKTDSYQASSIKRAPLSEFFTMVSAHLPKQRKRLEHRRHTNSAQGPSAAMPHAAALGCKVDALARALGDVTGRIAHEDGAVLASQARKHAWIDLG